MREIERITRAFAIEGEVRSVERWGSGHINDSYAVLAGRSRYFFQRLNHEVFPDPVAVMENIRRVTTHLEPGSDPRRALTLVPTLSGETYHRDEAGNYWRVFPFIENTRSFDVVPNAAVAREGARAFGRFIRQLDDLPAPGLKEVLPGFHHTPSRFGEF
jgi:hypothetical protein